MHHGTRSLTRRLAYRGQWAHEVPKVQLLGGSAIAWHFVQTFAPMQSGCETLLF